MRLHLGNRREPGERADRRIDSRGGESCGDRLPHAGDAGEASREDHVRGGRHDRSQQRHRFDSALEIGVPCKARSRRARRRDRLDRCVRRAGDCRRAAAEQQALRDRPREIRDLAVERAGRSHAQRARGSAESVDDAAAIDGNRGGEGAAELEENQRDVALAATAAFRLLMDGKRDGADLVGRSHVDAIDFPVRGHRRQMHDAWRKHDGQRRRSERAHQRPQPADAARFSFRREVRQAQIVVSDVLRANERQPVAGRAGNEIERRDPMRGIQHVDDHRRVRKRVRGRQRSIEKHRAIVESTDVDGDGAGIDPDDARRVSPPFVATTATLAQCT